ncbi:MAG: MATE family efflux transporter [Porphyromonadaceae bacterium]|nr:MATE family efflux transporter [Porphyromonadaceae bacterium]
MYSNKKIFQITYPIFLTLIAQNIINVTDTAFLGRVSEVALGASAIGGVFYIAIYFVGYGFSQGAQIMIARRNGERNFANIGPIFDNALLFNLVLAVVITFLSFLSIPFLIRYLVHSDNIYHTTIEFLNWRIIGFLFAFLTVIFRAFFVGITRTKVLTVAAIITAVTNILLDYILIFGKFGFPELGIAGAGIASTAAELISLIYLVFVTLKLKDREIFNLFRFAGIDFQTIGKILSLSIFIMFQFFISISTWFMFFIFIERLGERPLAITNIGRSLHILLMIPGSALSTTVNTLVSNMIGEGHKEQVIPFIHKTLKMVLMMLVPLMIFTFAFPQFFARIYTNNLELVAASLPTLRVISVAMIFCGMSSILFNAISGTGNTRATFLIEFVTLFFYIVFVYYTAVFLHSAVEIVWLSEFVYWIIIGGLSYWYLKNGNWRKKVV